ncbi:MAG TPA: hypothetical protein VGM56_25270 [Byssovorax sp.]
MPARCLARRASVVLALAGAAFASVAFGCSSSSTGAPTTTGLMGDGSCGLTDAENSEWCKSIAITPDCSSVIGFTTDVCGLPVTAPSTPLARSSDVMEFAGSGAPDLSCVEVGHYPVAGTSQTVKAQGRARIFSNGCESNDLTIEFHTVIRDGTDNEGNLGPLVGQAVVTEDMAGCLIDGTPTDSMQCGTRYECPYEYDGLPSETELVVLTKGTEWQPLYDYNIYISNTDVTNGVWAHDVRALATTDYSLIPTAAYGHTITTGNGAIAGEVHDCGDVRVSGATVNVDLPNAALVYFTGAEDAPEPIATATSTNELGLYAAFDMAPGTITVAALGEVDNATTTLGYFRARIFPDSVTAVTLHGVYPFELTSK